MKYRKGSTIATWDYYKIIPLFDWDDRQKSFILLPKFQSLPEIYSLSGFLAQFSDDDEQVKSLIRKIITRPDSSGYFKASIVVSLFLVSVDNALKWINVNAKEDAAVVDDTDDSYFRTSLHRQSWTLVKDKISFDEWKHLSLNVLQNMHIVTRDHPLIAYSEEHIPYMSTSELDDVVDILQLETKSRSSIAIQNLVQQFGNSETVPTFVIIPLLLCDMKLPDDLHNVLPINSMKHSCLPTAHLELGDDNETVLLKALFDIPTDEDVSISYVRGDDDTLEQRDSMLQYRIRQSCLCIRCRYDLDDVSGPLEDLSHSELTRIGHYLMVKEEFHEAKRIYRIGLNKALLMRRKDLGLVEIYHALGAIELSLGNFLDAQRIWNDANNDYPDLCSRHEGMMLQMEKIKSYGYLDDDDNDDDECRKHISDPWLKWKSPAPNCFVTPILDGDVCQKIIQWAEDLGTWTRKRHYAVPTFDVPVHTVPPLLDWFQNEFMNPIVQLLLAKQFKTNKGGRFYVHDAFCVRYESSAVSNHLPIHTDESTHSLVVALNDSFEGGGTYLFDYDIVMCPVNGSVISFRGDIIPHGGQAVTKGVRYILAVFLYHDMNNRKLGKTERDATELNDHLHISKQRKTDFSFNFDC